MSVNYTYNPPTEPSTTVAVTFTKNDITHVRDVNAVFVNGIYDAELTEQRVVEVANGVNVKIDAGVIRNPEENTSEGP